ncbi:MAG: leucine-rich repeat domain-containing protein, partial [Promethearchaeota archaeon]
MESSKGYSFNMDKESSAKYKLSLFRYDIDKDYFPKYKDAIKYLLTFTVFFTINWFFNTYLIFQDDLFSFFFSLINSIVISSIFSSKKYFFKGKKRVFGWVVEASLLTIFISAIIGGIYLFGFDGKFLFLIDENNLNITFNSKGNYIAYGFIGMIIGSFIGLITAIRDNMYYKRFAVFFLLGFIIGVFTGFLIEDIFGITLLTDEAIFWILDSIIGLYGCIVLIIIATFTLGLIWNTFWAIEILLVLLFFSSYFAGLLESTLTFIIYSILVHIIFLRNINKEKPETVIKYFIITNIIILIRIFIPMFLAGLLSNIGFGLGFLIGAVGNYLGGTSAVNLSLLFIFMLSISLYNVIAGVICTYGAINLIVYTQGTSKIKFRRKQLIKIVKNYDLDELEFNFFNQLILSIQEFLEQDAYFYNIKKYLSEIKCSQNHVIELKLIKMELKSLPYYIENLKNLEKLDLSKNKLINLPSTIGALKNLKELDLSYNNLTSLPDTIGNLINLNKLNLSKNNFSVLPESIGNLINLQEINLMGNKLTALPESIGNLTNLKELDLNNHDLSALPESIGNLTNLKKLALFNNNIISLPESIGYLEKLEKLDLGNNKLTSLPESIGNL